MKRRIALRLREQTAMAVVCIIAFLGLMFMADESENITLATFMVRKVIGHGLFIVSLLIGRYFYRAGIIREPKEEV